MIYFTLLCFLYPGFKYMLLLLILCVCTVLLLVVLRYTESKDDTFKNDWKMVVHYHITHCAGTKLLDIVNKNELNPPNTRPWFYDFEDKSPHEVESMFLYSGWKWGEIEIPLPHTQIPWQSPSILYTIILREPLSRAIANDGFMAEYPEIKADNDYSRWVETIYCDNYLTRWITNTFTAEPLTEEHLQLAKDLLGKFDLVLILERFPEDAKKLRDVLGWKHWYPGSKRKRKSVKDKIGQRNYERLKERNVIDIKLYEYATKIF